MPAQGDMPEGYYARVGGRVGKIKVSLRICGADLDLDEISEVLGSAPSRSHRVGDPKGKHVQGSYSSSGWFLHSRLDGSSDLEAHIRDILGRLSDNVADWQKVSKHSPDLFCGLFLSGLNQGVGLTPETLAMIACRGIELSLDIYSDTSGD
ncbi:MAG: DUF4279 domain-containing protein [bacterium]|nr:DUF4279 domain-containing protein [bacterium]